VVKISKRLGLYEFLDKVSIGLVEGNMYYSNQDFRIPGRVPVRFNRQYNSHTEKVGPLGMGWSHEYYRRLKINSDYIIYKTELLQEISFKKSAEGNWYSSTQKDLILKEIPEGYSLVVIPGQSYIYNKTGELTSISYRDGIRLDFEHTGGLLSKIITMSGRTLDISYNELGLIEAVTSKAGSDIRRVVYEYDNYTNLTSVTDPMGNITDYQYLNNNIVKITDAEKREVNFIYNSDDKVVKAWAEGETNLKTFIYNPGKRSSVMMEGNGAKTVLYYNEAGLIEKERRPDGNEYNFRWNEAGRLIQIARPDNKSVYLAYDGNGDLISETDADGGRTQFEYNEHRQMTLGVDPNYQAVKYIYNECGNMIQAVEPGKKITRFKNSEDGKTMEIINPNGGKRIFRYDEDGNTIAIIDEMGYTTKCEYDRWGWLKRIINPDGGVTEKLLDENNLEIKVIQPDNTCIEFQRDKTGYIKEITRPRGAKTLFSYDTLGRCTTMTDPLGKSFVYVYDSANNLVKVIDVMGFEKELEYDLAGRPVAVKKPDGSIERMFYDAVGDLNKFIDSKGYATSFEYNGKSQITKTMNPMGYTKEFQYDYKGQLVRSINESGNQTYYRYSIEGYPIETAYPDGGTISNGYDLNGNMIFSIDQEGRRTEFEYDGLNRLVVTKDSEGYIKRFAYDQMGRLVSMTDESGVEIKFAYDQMGRKISEIDGLGNKKSYEYDERGNLIKETEPSGGVTTRQYDLSDRVITATDAIGGKWSYGYDAFGNVTDITNPEGCKTVKQYDIKNRLVKTISPTGNVTQAYFDTLGNIIKSIDPMGNMVEMNYDPLGRVTEIIRKALDGNGQENVLKEVNEYDPVGSIRKVIDAMGNATEFVYDSMHRSIKTINPMGKEETYSYNRKGEMISKKDYNGRETLYKYDSRGMLKNVIMPDSLAEEYSYAPNGLLTSVKTNSFEEQYGYDKSNRLTFKKTIAPFGAEIKYQYDDVKKTLSIKDSFGTGQKHEYDLLDRIKTIQDPFEGRWQFAYTPAGLRESLVYPNKMTCKYTYDDEGRLVKKTANKDKSLIEAFEYSYDRNSRIINEKSLGRSNTYCYDALGQLVKAVLVENPSGKEYTQTFDYDKAGNLLLKKEKDKAFPYSYDKDNRLLSAGSIKFTHDENGNTILKKSETENSVYKYDAQNRLNKVEGDTGESINFGYSQSGSRISKSVMENGVETSRHYLQDGANVLRELKNGREESYNIYGPGMDELLAVKTPQGMNYILSDVRGSICKITDPNGKVLENNYYSPFGARSKKSDITPFSFTGREYDPETSLHYYRARYYDSETGRFINKDPIGISGGANLYSYCGNDPVNNIDPSGNFWWFLAGAALSGLAAVGFDFAIGYCRSKAESITDYAKSGQYSWKRAAVTGAAGMLSMGVGGLVASLQMRFGYALLTTAVADATISTTQEGIISNIENKDFNLKYSFLQNLALSGLGYAIFRPRPVVTPKVRGVVEESVELYHGSINNATKIRRSGLDIQRTSPTYVSSDIKAARDAIEYRLRNFPHEVTDSGIIKSLIPKSEIKGLEESIDYLIREYKGFYGSNLNSTEMQLITSKAKELFNKYIIK
jgi:RHS repeat-associated protein